MPYRTGVSARDEAEAGEAREPLLTRLWRFGRSVLVGLVATAADVSTLAILVQIVHLTPTQANVPSLLVGMAIQFVGVRRWVFHAQEGSVRAQVLRFGLAEAGTLALNALVFHLLVTRTPIPYWLDRPIGTALVYVGFSYHAWKRVFAHAAPPEDEAGDADPDDAEPPSRAGGEARRRSEGGG